MVPLVCLDCVGGDQKSACVGAPEHGQVQGHHALQFLYLLPLPDALRLLSYWILPRE